MEKGIKESLAAGTICHSTSPVGTEFLTGNGSLVLLTSDYKKFQGYPTFETAAQRPCCPGLCLRAPTKKTAGTHSPICTKKFNNSPN